ncbi:Uncharacterized protein YrrD, contains PRC-barrel domain [Clostridium sp. USBA 49]|jgi:uncharacterized protein YrrD|uniref:PRC-barrel domain-containing protein n=1 Tax=Clostridium TaxID=1485 RepID=UPI000999F068|nr:MULTISPECIES: PRC-barrel domain-containing protein [Clostridium]SKA75910.1 Uncharacterized protein YrrD, contains PRC-barrel domain [Clostridium sp. USBA 49]
MFRVKDFILMDVIDIKGKKIGFIKDIIIDFNKGEVKGFVISPYNLFLGNRIILKPNIISFNKAMVINGWSKDEFLTFSSIKNMDVKNKYGDIIGIVEDLLFHEFTFKIKGIIVSLGILKNFMIGKKILLINSVILGEKYILNYKDYNKVDFISIPHKLFMEVESHEKNI